jgi:hypothetical protein
MNLAMQSVPLHSKLDLLQEAAVSSHFFSGGYSSSTAYRFQNRLIFAPKRVPNQSKVGFHPLKEGLESSLGRIGILSREDLNPPREGLESSHGRI